MQGTPSVAHDGIALLAAEQIDLVQPDDDGPPALDAKPQQASVLLGDAFGGVTDEDHGFGATDGANGTNHADCLDSASHSRTSADSGGIDDQIRLSGKHHAGVDRITGGPGTVVDERPLLSGKSVQQRRLAGIGDVG